MNYFTAVRMVGFSDPVFTVSPHPRIVTMFDYRHFEHCEVFDVVTEMNTNIILLCQVTLLGCKITNVLGRYIGVNMRRTISRIGLCHIYSTQGRDTEVTQLRHG